MTIRRILAPTDFSDASVRAVQYAAELANTLGAQLIILTVVEPAYRSGAKEIYVEGGVRIEDAKRSAARELSRLAERTIKQPIKHRAVVLTGVAYRQITAAADRYGADVIVMATHGRTGLPRLLMGSVAERVLRTSTRPVLALGPGKPLRRRRRSSAK